MMNTEIVSDNRNPIPDKSERNNIMEHILVDIKEDNSEDSVKDLNESSDWELQPIAIQNWVAKVSYSSDDTVEAILRSAKVVFDAENALGTQHGKEAVRQFRKDTRLSQSMLSKMKCVGEKANLFLSHKATLPASLTTLYGLTKLNPTQFAEKLQTDLRGVSRVKVEKLVGVKSAMCPLISFRIAADVSEDTMIEILDDMKDAARALSESYKTPIEVSSIAIDKDRLGKSDARALQREDVRKGKKAFESIRDKFREYRKELMAQGLDRAAINERFKARFSNTYKEVLGAEDPWEIYEQYSGVDWLSDEESACYKTYVGDYLADAPFASKSFTHFRKTNDEILEDAFFSNENLKELGVLKDYGIQKADPNRFSDFT